VSAAVDIVRVDDLVKDVRPGFGLRKKRLLDGISFRVREREIFGFIGPNGAGKTTTLKVLMGLIRATSGQASILGHDVSEITFRRQIGFLPEQPYFYDYLTGREILRFYAKLSGVSPACRELRVAELLELVGLSAAGSTRLRNYSKGMLQRIGVAQALVHDPQVVFLDEPMSGLDPVGRKEVRDIILSLREQGRTVFFSSHILQDAEMICDRVAIIHRGRLDKLGTLEELLTTRIREFEIVASGVEAGAIEAIEKSSKLTMKRADDVLFVIEKREDADAAVDRIRGGGGHLISFTPRRETLEDYFLGRVGRGTRDAEAEKAGQEVA